MELDTYRILTVQKVEVLPILADHFADLLKSVKRKISPRQSIRNPWKIIVKMKIYHSIYYEFFRAVRDWSSEFGRSISIERGANGLLKTQTISFTHKGTFVYHISRVVGERFKVNDFLKKSVTGGGFGKLLFSSANPVVFIFNVQKNELVVSGTYQLVNRYGNVMN